MDITIDRKKLFKTFARFLISLFIVNFLANKLYWYNSIWWFDMLTHFWGGICVGIGMLWFLSRKTLSLELNLKLVYQVALGVLVVGVLWELYEIVVYNIIAQNPFIALDTFSDIFFDLAGGSFAVLYFFKKIMPTALNKVE